MGRKHGAFLVTSSTAALVAGAAAALEAGSVSEEPVRVDVTNTSTVSYNADNRNDRAADVTRFADDEWGVFHNRLNAQANWQRWHAGLRLDTAWFYTSPDATGIALDMLRFDRGGTLSQGYDDSDVQFFLQSLQQADAELSNRYVNWTYPAKYYVGYQTADVEATLGDFYAQLGRGLVLSVRKLDEVSSDTTIRGARMTGRVRLGDLRLELTGLGGTMNPLRLDEPSGRYLAVAPRGTLSSITEAGMPRPVASAFQDDPAPTYATDRLAAFQVEAKGKLLAVGLQGSLLDRSLLDTDDDGDADEALSPGVIRSARRIPTGSVSFDFPNLDGHGSAYLEAALQGHEYPTAIRAADDARPAPERILPGTGHAVYASLSATARPLTFTAEGKHYRRFFPLQGNVDIGAAREFSTVQYSAPPTTEAFFVDTEFENFNTCVTGGRGKADVQVGPDESVFLWAGHYATWAESVTNEQCRVDSENENRVWDLASGLEITSQRRKSRASGLAGARFDDTLREIAHPVTLEPTHVFYRELYARYDVIRWLGGPWSLQLQGFHRRRRQTLGGPADVYFQGQHLTAVTWDRLTVGFGVEYDTNPQFPDTYLNGQLSYRFDSASRVSVFGGQRRGGLRCVSGVCRVFPPFEGAHADLTLRF